MRNELVQFLVDLPGLMWAALCSMGTVLLVLAVWAGLIVLCLGTLYAWFVLFFSPPTVPRVLTTSDLWWILGLIGFVAAMAGEKK